MIDWNERDIGAEIRGFKILGVLRHRSKDNRGVSRAGAYACASVVGEDHEGKVYLARKANTIYSSGRPKGRFYLLRFG